MRCLWAELVLPSRRIHGWKEPVWRESVMVSQCANPDCRRELRYLRDGKIYAFATSAGNGSKSLEHFWLCGECSKSMTLTCLKQSEVKTVRRRQVTSHRGSAA